MFAHEGGQKHEREDYHVGEKEEDEDENPDQAFFVGCHGEKGNGYGGKIQRWAFFDLRKRWGCGRAAALNLVNVGSVWGHRRVIWRVNWRVVWRA